MSPADGHLAVAYHGNGALPSRTLSGLRTPAAISIAKLILLTFVHVPFAYAAPLIPRALKISEDEDLPKSPEDSSLWAYLGTAIALVLLGGAFAGLTIALMGQDEIYLQVIATSGEGSERKNAGKVLNLLKKGKHWVLVTLLLSNVITNETLPIVLDRSLGGGWPAVVSSTILIVIFGEIVPQSICVRYGLPIGAWMSPFVLALMWLMAPVAWPTAKLLDRLLGEDHGTTYKKAGLKTLVTLHKTLGSTPGERLNEDEVTIISAVLDLKEKPVGDIMTPMNDVFTMSADTVLDEKMMDTILSQGYSRIPIYAPENPRNFIGMLLVKILITYDPEDSLRVRDFSLATLPETAPHTSCLDIVNFFQEGKSHMVLVSDFPGQDRGALGVVTLEDVIEELIGEEIIDESDVFVDVHRAIRRSLPAPRTKYTKPNAISDVSDASRESDVETHETDGLLPKQPPSRKSSLTESRDTTFLMRRRSSGGSVKDQRPLAVRSNTTDMRQHLRHLGPSNVASRPKATKYTSVKIKPGVSTIPEGGVPGSHDQSVGSPRSLPVIRDEAEPNGNADTAGPVNGTAQPVKNGHTGGYGTMDGGDSIRITNEQQLDREIERETSPPRAPQTAAEASAQAEQSAREGRTTSPVRDTQPSKEDTPEPEPSQPEKLVVPSGASRRASHNDDSGSESSGSVVGELESRRPSRVRRAARSGSITENVIDVGGMKKVVLETTSSSEADEGQKSGDLDGTNESGSSKVDGDEASKGDGQRNGAGDKKKKRRKRAGKKVREREAARKNGED